MVDKSPVETEFDMRYWFVIFLVVWSGMVEAFGYNYLRHSQSLRDTSNIVFGFESAGMTGAGRNAPFWHTANRQGLTSFNKDNGYTHFSCLGVFVLHKGFVMDYGIDLGLGANHDDNCYVHQLFFDISYKWLDIEVGMKERWSDKNPQLSSGALTWSGNSKPIPEIRAGIPDYVRIPKLGSWFSVKGQLGYGRLTDDVWRKENGVGSYAQGVIFHSKSLFVRFGDEERFPLQVTLGLEINNLFGGVRYAGGNERKMPDDAAAYWTALFPFHKIEQQGTDDGDNLGSWHLNFDYTVSDWHIGAYYEHFYEDHSSMLGIEYKNNQDGEKDFLFYGFRRNWMDGLFGIEVNAPEGVRIFRDAVFEFMNTKGQSGSICHSAASKDYGKQVIEEIDGRDGMYNHSVYESYTHNGYAIGNPVLISPVYYGGDQFRSNRVQMFHLGVEGGITKSLDYRALATTTRHWGQYGAPLKEVERVTSVMLECSYKFGGEYGWRVSLSGAADFDSGSDGAYLLGNNRGVMLTISKSWKVL